MEETLIRFVTNLVGRLTGPMGFRLFLQPAVAMFFAIRDGLQDARDGRSPHLWQIVTGPPEARRRRIRETWRAVLKVFIMALVVDGIYQVIVVGWVYPVEALVTGVVLAFVPYVLLRGIVTRIARRWIRPQGHSF